MSTQIKYLAFKGIEKKEQILFKSFLNLAKNELAYQVVILKEKDEQRPDIVIVESGFEFSSDDAELSELPAITIGNELSDDQTGYITRPVQWSDFKTELTRLEFEAASEDEGDSEDRVLPDEMQFVIAEMDDRSESTAESDQDDSFSDAGEYDYELGNMSIDYHSFTNSEYMRAADDVKGFQDGEEGAAPGVVLMTDDESNSTNSVLVIETNSLDAWEMSESEFDDDGQAFTKATEDSDYDDLDEKAEKEISKKLSAGTPVNHGDEYWKYDLEIFSGRESLLFTKPEREMVYSKVEPAKWTKALSEETVTKHPLDDEWHPMEGLKAYPMNRLLWANTIITNNESLTDGLAENAEYMLERWPHFELLELDNVLLKLCTLLFVGPESPYSLMQKSGYGRNVVFGLINACFEMGILRNADEIEHETLSDASNEDGVFGKLKDVFR